MQAKLITLLFLIILVFSSPALVRAKTSPLDRYRLIEDRYRTFDRLTGQGRDFLFQIGAAANLEVFDILDDIDAADKVSGDAAKVEAYQGVLEKYDNYEQIARITLDLAGPLPSFSLGSLAVRPALRVKGEFGANIHIREGEITADTVRALFSDAPAATKNKLSTLTDAQVQDFSGLVLESLEDAGLINSAERTLLATQIGDLPVSSLSDPSLAAYTKLDARTGIDFALSHAKYFGGLFIYGLHRTDINKQAFASQLVTNSDVLDLPKNKNSQVLLMTDLQIGHDFDWIRAFFSLEELKLATLSDSVAKGGDLFYGADPLIRLHAEKDFSLWSIVRSRAFLGLHKRSGYKVSEGIYGGMDAGAYFWNDRIATITRLMFDKEHFSLSPRVKLYLMQLEYGLKLPLKSRLDDGLKVSTIHSANVRFFF